MLTLLSYSKAKNYYASGIWQNDTFYSLIQKHAIKNPQGFALRDGSRRLTWSELLNWIDHISEQLANTGLKVGDRVAIWLPSRVEGVASFLACSRNGYVACTSLHQNYTLQEISEFLKRSRAVVLIMMPGYGGNKDSQALTAMANELEDLKQIFSVDNIWDDHFLPLSQKTTPVDGKVSLPMVHDDPDSIVYLAFTSGTTGTPKGVMHSNNTLLANGRAMLDVWQYPTHSIMLSISPMSHHIGTVALEQWAVGGYELVLNYPPHGLSIIEWIIETKANYILGVPTHAIDILGHLQRLGLSQLGDVNIFYMAGSIIPIEVAKSFLAMGITPQNIYGMTENGSHQFTAPTDDAKTIIETCGRAARGYETIIVDQNNPNIYLSAGQVGEIATRGGLLMLGYYDNQKATEDSFNHEGWFLSGDLGLLDYRGCLQIIGRKKDLIIRGGHNIYPSYLEDLAHRHPAIIKCAAFGVPDIRLGEKVAMTLLLKEGLTINAADFLMHLHQAGLSKYDMPEYLGIVHEFPVTASGKILKRELLEMFKHDVLKLEPIRFTEPKP
jgi:acyl-CoA synthetase